MYRRFQAGHGADDSFPVAETFHDWGFYSQVLWGFKKGWVAGDSWRLCPHAGFHVYR
jgi:hypothetical protein